MPKDISGENNPFYGKKHSEESKKKMGGAVVDYTGVNNPFYGRKHKKESIDAMKEKLSEKFSGSGNPFYGKSHSPDAIEKIKQKNLEYREANKEELLKERLIRLKINKEKLESSFLEYCNTRKNADDISKDLKIDKRVFFKYVEEFGVASADEIQKIKHRKRMNNSKSSPEEKFYKLFCLKYGEENVIWSHKINSYFYDFFLFNLLLVEYDGYYWHSVLESKNDKNKDNLAKTLNIPLYRIKENEKRQCDFELELQKINEVLNEIQINRNKVQRI